MPAPLPTLTADDARRLVAEHGFAAAPGVQVGVEAEWVVLDPAAPARAVPAAEVADAVADRTMPAGSRLTFEPGGQVELSTPPLPDADAACDVLARDATALADALSAHGLVLVAIGLDPRPVPPRCIDAPRYEAMEAYFDAASSAGRTMMRSTAAIQVNVGLGAEPAVARRWELAHLIAAPLAAAFANSPFADGAPTGRSSERLHVWSKLDRARTTPVGADADHRSSWAEYALAAPVMLVRASDQRFVAMLEPMPFARWLHEGHDLGFPTRDDLEYHLTTLFPPVRPRGWLELRMFDALPDPWWRVPVAVTAALLDEGDTHDELVRACTRCADAWDAAAVAALEDPALHAAAAACFAVALDALRAGSAPRALLEVVAAYEERYVRPGRTPADDRLDDWHACGALFPAPERFVTS